MSHLPGGKGLLNLSFFRTERVKGNTKFLQVQKGLNLLLIIYS